MLAKLWLEFLSLLELIACIGCAKECEKQADKKCAEGANAKQGIARNCGVSFCLSYFESEDDLRGGM